MFVKTKFKEGMKVVDFAKFAGVAPCTILAANRCSESELIGRDIWLPVSTPNMVRSLPFVFEVEDGQISKIDLTEN